LIVVFAVSTGVLIGRHDNKPTPTVVLPPLPPLPPANERLVKTPEVHNYDGLPTNCIEFDHHTVRNDEITGRHHHVPDVVVWQFLRRLGYPLVSMMKSPIDEIRAFVKEAQAAGRCVQCRFPWHDGLCECGPKHADGWHMGLPGYDGPKSSHIAQLALAMGNRELYLLTCELNGEDPIPLTVWEPDPPDSPLDVPDGVLESLWDETQTDLPIEDDDART
jgi:hypothetical protein